MRFLVMLAVATLSSTPTLDGQRPAAPDFRPLEFLVGSCWIGTFPDGQKTDEHCFEWVFDRKFIRDRHAVRGADGRYDGETLFGWDDREKRLAFWYWNSNGQMITGTAEYTPEGIVFPSRYDGEHGPVELKSIWTPAGPDGYHVWQGQRAGTEWKTLWTVDFKRRPRLGAPPSAPARP